jgi:hypothetical protein
MRYSEGRNAHARANNFFRGRPRPNSRSGVITESSQNPTPSEIRRVIIALRKRSFVKIALLTISCCATQLPNPFEWQQVYAAGLSV